MRESAEFTRKNGVERDFRIRYLVRQIQLHAPSAPMTTVVGNVETSYSLATVPVSSMPVGTSRLTTPLKRSTSSGGSRPSIATATTGLPSPCNF
jgi:hypothetical protein